MSEQFLATASVRIVPDVTGFAAALQAEVAAATRSLSLKSALAANTVATKTFTAATGTSTIAVKQAAVALEQEGAAAATSAAETRLSAKAAREAAVAHSQMARGIGTATASQFGLRGAVLASSGPFLAAVVAVETVRKTIDAYSGEVEAAARVNAILGKELGRSSEEWAKQQAAIGLSAEAALKYQGAIAQVFRNVKIASDENAQFSQNLVARAVDVAARSNVPVTDVLRAFQLALSGNLRGLRQFVPAVDAATIANRALADTGKKVKAELTTQELVLARYEVLMQTSANQAGAFADRQGGLAAQTKILESNLANLGATIGSAVVPVITPLVELTTHLASNLQKLATASDKSAESEHHQGAASKVLHAALRETDREYGILIALTKRTDKAVADVSAAFGFQTALAKRLKDGTASLAEQEAVLAAKVREGGSAGAIAANQLLVMDAAAHQLAGGLDVAKNSAASLISVLAALGGQVSSALGGLLGGTNEAVVLRQIQGGSLQQVLQAQQAAVAVAQGAAASAILGAIGADPTTKAGAAAIQKRVDAENAAKAAVDAVTGTKAQIAAAAKKGAAADKKAAKTAQEIRDAEDQRLLFEQQRAQTLLQIKAVHVQHTKSLVDDVQLFQAELALTNQQIVGAAKIHDAQTRINTILQLQLQAATLQTQIEDAIAQQKQNARDRKVAAAEAKVTIAGLDAQLAETLGHPHDRIAALRRQNAALEAEKKLWQGNGVKLREIRNQIAENNKTIKEIQGEQVKGISAALQFQFLQTQQGFAANLLGNLIPTGATAGLVGGPTSGAISTATSVPGFAATEHGSGGFGTPGGDLASATRTAAGVRGASAGQMSTLIHINSQMLAALMRLSGRGAAPEAGRQHWWTATPFTDTFGW